MHKDLFKNKKYIPAGTLVVGVDIAKERQYACGITSRGEHITKPFSFENRRSGMDSFLERIGRWMKETGCEDLVVGMEPTGPYWKSLDAYLDEKGIRVVLVNPFHTKMSRELYDNSPRKDDKKDALLIARMIDEGKYLEKGIRTEEEENLGELLEYRNSLVEKRVSLGNQILSKLDEYFPEFSDVFKSVNGKASLALLQTSPLPGDVLAMGEESLSALMRSHSRGNYGLGDARRLMELARESVGKKKGSQVARIVIKGYAEDLGNTLALIEEVESQMDELMREMPDHRILDTIPGVSRTTIASVLSGIGDMRRYPSSKAVLKQLGLNVCVAQSGKRKGERCISKRGCSLPRKLLYCVIPSLVQPGGIFHSKYEEMRKRGVHYKVIFVALACKLVKIMFSMVHDGRPFERDYHPENRKTGKAERIVPTHLRVQAA